MGTKSLKLMVVWVPFMSTTVRSMPGDQGGGWWGLGTGELENELLPSCRQSCPSQLAAGNNRLSLHNTPHTRATRVLMLPMPNHAYIRTSAQQSSKPASMRCYCCSTPVHTHTHTLVGDQTGLGGRKNAAGAASHPRVVGAANAASPLSLPLAGRANHGASVVAQEISVCTIMFKGRVGREVRKGVLEVDPR